MVSTERNFERTCNRCIERFCDRYGDRTMQKRAVKALRFIMVSDQPLRGKPEGWAAGIIYALATRGHQACGVPGVLNADLEHLFGVTMSTVRRRAAQVGRALRI